METVEEPEKKIITEIFKMAPILYKDKNKWEWGF